MARLRWMENARTGDARTVCKGNLDITGDLNVDGTLNYAAGGLTISQVLMGTFTVGDTSEGYDVKFYGDDSSKYWLWSAASNKVDMVGAFDIDGNMEISNSGTLIVDGTTTLNSATTVNATLDVTGKLTTAAVDITGAVSITGDVTMEVASKINFRSGSNYINSNGSSTLVINATTIAMATDVTVSGTLDVTGASTLTGNVTCSGTLGVVGALTFGSLGLGTSGSPKTLTEGTPKFSVYTTCASSHASTTAVASYFDAVMTVAAGVGRALEAVLTVDDVKLGSWSNAIKGKIDFSTSGSGAGLMSAICAEMIMPAATMSGYGNYAPLEIEFVCPLSWAGTPQSVSFMNINLAIGSTGDTTGNFDDIGYLMVINGLADGDGNCLRNNTLKMKVGSDIWYLPLSSAQGSYTTVYPVSVTVAGGTAITIGTSTTGIALSGTYTNAIDIDTTLAASGLGMELTVTAPLGTVGHKWTAAQTIDITQSSRIQSGSSPAWSARGRLMAGDYDVNINDTVTNVFGVIAKINILNTMNTTGNNDTNDLQALVGIVNVDAPSGTTLQSQSTSTICGVKGGISRSETGAITLDHNVYAGVFSYNMDGSSVSGNTGILELYNYGSDTCDAGIYIHPFGTLTVGIELDDADSGVFTTGISIDSCATANIAISGTNATGIAMTGTYSGIAISVANTALTAGDAYSGIKCAVTAANPNNEYGASGYFQADITGTQAGHFYGLGSWVNIANAAIGGGAGKYLCAQDNGIYVDTPGGEWANTLVVFGMRVECIGLDSDTLRFPFSINTGGVAPGLTALFDINSLDEMSRITSATEQSEYVPIFRTSAGDMRYVRLYTAS